METGDALSLLGMLNEVLYMNNRFDRKCLVAYDLQAGSRQDLRLLAIDDQWEDWGKRGDLVVCNSKLMMVVTPPEVSFDGAQMLLVLHIDLVSRQVKEVARGANLGRFHRRRPVGVGNCMYVEIQVSGMDPVNNAKLMMYDVQEDEGSCSDFPLASGRGTVKFDAFFQPGLCLFH